MTASTLLEAARMAREALENFDRFRRMMTDGPDASDKLLAEDYAEMAFLQGVQALAALDAAIAEASAIEAAEAAHQPDKQCTYPKCQDAGGCNGLCKLTMFLHTNGTA